MKKIKNFKLIAKNVIDIEIQSLKKLKNNISISFEKAVKAILNCKQGKIVISGTGKSGIIGKKISSTFSSVGIPSFFVDAGACSHGDLGVIGSNDVVILISNSGESEELKNIIQYTKRNKKITLIGIVSKKNSILYSSANIKLLIPNIKEADPAGVVPTSSTIIQLSIGDALAVATMEQRNFGKLDFKKFHPSGTLGTRLKTAEDLMIAKNKLPLINENKLMNIGLKIISKKISTLQGGLLIIDYGYLEKKMKNSLQSVHKHNFNNILKNLGNSDITYNISFSLLKKILNKLNLSVVGITTQKNFLKRLGIMQRAEILARNLKFSKKADIYYRLNRLVDNKFMGTLFKVMFVTKKNNKFKVGF